MDELDFGVRIRSRRRLLKMSQDDLGKAVGVSQVAIRKIEAGGQTRHGRKLAEVLQTTLQWLEVGQDPSTNATGDLVHHAGAPSADVHTQPADSNTQTDKAWPLKKATLKRLQALTPKQRARADAAIDDLLRGYEAEREKI